MVSPYSRVQSVSVAKTDGRFMILERLPCRILRIYSRYHLISVLLRPIRFPNTDGKTTSAGSF